MKIASSNTAYTKKHITYEKLIYIGRKPINRLLKLDIYTFDRKKDSPSLLLLHDNKSM